MLELGRAIVRGRSAPPPPVHAAAVAAAGAPPFAARADRVCFLRSHLVLNSAYFLAQRDVLALGPSVEAVVAPFERPPAGGACAARATVAAVRYPSAALAAAALARFRSEYLRDADPGGNAGAVRIEDGWAGYRLAGRGVALVFEGPGRADAEALLAAAAAALSQVEVPHE